MSNTPRSDQVWENSVGEDDFGAAAMYHGAQTLELELASMTAERDALRAALERLLDVGLCAGYGVEEARAALSGKEGAK